MVRLKHCYDSIVFDIFDQQKTTVGVHELGINCGILY